MNVNPRFLLLTLGMLHLNVAFAQTMLPRHIMPPASLLTSSETSPQSWQPGNMATIGVQGLTGSAAAAVAVGLGYLFSYTSFGEEAANPKFYWGSVVAGSAAVPYGASLGGDWMGGNGSLGYTYVGGAVGALAAVILAQTSVDHSSDYFDFAPFAPIPIIVGSIVGYHLSAHSTESANGVGANDDMQHAKWQFGVPSISIIKDGRGNRFVNARLQLFAVSF